jgi:hypothetical protein
MRPRATAPINTLDRAIELARAITYDIAGKDAKSRRNFRVFQALTRDDREALAAYLIWRLRGLAL